MKLYAQRRMQKLINHLRYNVKRHNFNMGKWYQKTSQCGTVACIGGHACEIPAFKKAGLKLTIDLSVWPNTHKISFNGVEYEYALQYFFDLTTSETSKLFLEWEGWTNTPKTAARKLENFLKRKQKELKRGENKTSGAAH